MTPAWHHTTICAVRRDGITAVACDGQVTLGTTVLKHGASKLRRLGGGRVLAGFAGSVADALALFTRFETKLEEFAGNLERAAVELARDWRTDRALRHLEAMMIVADRDAAAAALRVGRGHRPRRRRARDRLGRRRAPWPRPAPSRAHRAAGAGDRPRGAPHRLRHRPLHQRPHHRGGAAREPARR